MHAKMLKLVLAAMLMLALGIAWLATMVQAEVERRVVLSPSPQHFTIVAGSSFANVARNLSERGILTRPRLVSLYARWKGHAGAIKAGEYEIDSGITVPELLELFVSGRVVQHSLTLIEGWTFTQTLEAVRQDNRLAHTLDGLDMIEIMARLDHPDAHPEGRFLADTYHFPRGTSDVIFLRRALNAMTTLLDTQWQARAPDLPYPNQYAALTMASIIEKETGRADERARIAGVFVRRLRKGMRLETDPTVIYGMGDDFDGNLRKRDLRADTPYNTYLHKGLPPTPIAMPGSAAIHAALHPADGQALFFVAKGDGSHQFSATYAEHREAVARYQLRRRKKVADNAGD